MIICWYCHNKKYSGKQCPHHEEEEGMSEQDWHDSNEDIWGEEE
tara:strand:+ start:159 stop:290 length:132 start_codon:yes stop_codon:yes gene_type:complete